MGNQMEIPGMPWHEDTPEDKAAKKRADQTKRASKDDESGAEIRDDSGWE